MMKRSGNTSAHAIRARVMGTGIALTLLLGAGLAQARNNPDSWRGWSKTKPEINLTHIFQGEINRRGKPTGFHARPGGKDPRNAHVKRIKSRPNKAGVYTARVEVYDRREKRWKSKFSTLFPDRLTHKQVIKAILHAWKKRDKKRNRPWRGPSGLGFPIEGYASRRGGINTAYPIYVRNRKR